MDITNIIEALIAFLAAVIAAFVIPWIKKKSSAADIDDMLTWIRIAVAAAEQIYKELEGNDKLQYVLRYLSNKGYDVKCMDIQNAVEAEVLKLHSELYGVKADE